MKKRSFTAAAALLLCLALSACGGEAADTGYTPHDQLPADYSAAQAAEDGCVVFEIAAMRQEPVAGQEIWESFLDEVQRGEPAMVRLVHFYDQEGMVSLEGENALPRYLLYDLSYDGSAYTVAYLDEEFLWTERQYPHLIYCEGEFSGEGYASSYHYNILTHDESLTYEQIAESWLNSDPSDDIDCIAVYGATYYTEVDPNAEAGEEENPEASNGAEEQAEE